MDNGAIILLPFVYSLVLIIWLKTNAFYEYIKVLKLDKIRVIKELFSLEEYENFVNQAKVSVNYSEFLSITNDDFFAKLVSCPICLTFWMSVAVVFIMPLYFPLVVILTLFIYNIYLILEKYAR